MGLTVESLTLSLYSVLITCIPQFLNLTTIDLLEWKILCYGGCLVYHRKFTSSCDLYLVDAVQTPQLSKNISPNFAEYSLEGWGANQLWLRKPLIHINLFCFISKRFTFSFKWQHHSEEPEQLNWCSYLTNVTNKTGLLLHQVSMVSCRY